MASQRSTVSVLAPADASQAAPPKRPRSGRLTRVSQLSGATFFIDTAVRPSAHFKRDLILAGARILPTLQCQNFNLQYFVTNSRQAALSSHGDAAAGSRRLSPTKVSRACRRRSTLLMQRGNSGDNLHKTDFLQKARTMGAAVVTVDEIQRLLNCRKSSSRTSGLFGEAVAGSIAAIPTFKRKRLALYDLTGKYAPVWKDFSEPNSAPVHDKSRPSPECPFVPRPSSGIPDGAKPTNHKSSLAGDNKAAGIEPPPSSRRPLRQRSGYCEVCRASFTCVESHYKSSRHYDASANTANWNVVRQELGKNDNPSEDALATLLARYDVMWRRSSNAKGPEDSRARLEAVRECLSAEQSSTSLSHSLSQVNSTTSHRSLSTLTTSEQLTTEATFQQTSG